MSATNHAAKSSDKNFSDNTHYFILGPSVVYRYAVTHERSGDVHVHALSATLH